MAEGDSQTHLAMEWAMATSPGQMATKDRDPVAVIAELASLVPAMASGSARGSGSGWAQG